MKKLLLTTALIMGLAGCSSAPVPQLTIAPKTTLATVPSVRNKALILESRDLRTAQYVAVIGTGSSNVQPIHANANLREVLQAAIADQLISQGYNLLGQSQGTFRVDLIDALVNVDQSGLASVLHTNVAIQLEVSVPGKKFTKRYTGKSTTQSGSSAAPQDMELALNSLLESVLNDMANDRQLSSFMQENL